MDTGVDIYGSHHPDLSFNVSFQNFVYELANNGCTGTFSSPSPCYYEEPFHGTGVIGSAVGTYHSSGSYGAAPSTAKGVNVAKVGYLNAQGVFQLPQADFADGVTHMSNLNVRLAVTSVGYNSNSEAAYATLHDAFAMALSDGTLFFAAAGNLYGSYVTIPAHFDEVVAVSALDRQGGSFVVAPFSSIGPEVELSAPATSVRIPWNRSNGDSSTYPGTRLESGTSFAAPLAMGVARLVATEHPTWSVGQIRQALRDYSFDLGPSGKDNSFGYGMVDGVCAILQWQTCVR